MGKLRPTVTATCLMNAELGFVPKPICFKFNVFLWIIWWKSILRVWEKSGLAKTWTEKWLPAGVKVCCSGQWRKAPAAGMERKRADASGYDWCQETWPGPLRARQTWPQIHFGKQVLPTAQQGTVEVAPAMTCCHTGSTPSSPPPAQLAAVLRPPSVPFLSKMSVWEQSESERVFNLPITHVPLATAPVCDFSVCVCVLYVI